MGFGRFVLVVVAAVAGAATFGYIPNPLLAISSGFNAEVATGMAAVYGSLRILKGVLMMAADANFSGGLAVVSFEGSPGQLVTPVIDTVERMANLVFALLIAAGLLAALIPIIGSWAAGLVAAGALLLAIFGWNGGRLPRSVASGAQALVLLGMFGAVLMPGGYTIASLVGDHYFPTSSHTAELEQIVAPLEETASLDADSVAEPSAEPNIWQQITGQIGGLVQSVGDFGVGTLDQVGKAIGSIGHTIDEAQALLQALIALAVAYILKLFVLPMVVIGSSLLVLRMVWRGARPTSAA